jgi:hypothetical protein
MLDFARSDSRNGSSGGRSLAEAARIGHAAWAFTTRRVDRGACGLDREVKVPMAGDLVLARVDVIGYHSELQLPDGRRKHLFIGDEIVLAYGNRYAPNRFEAVVPKTLGPCQLVAAGGVAGRALSWHASLSKSATQITPLGLLTGPNGDPVNLRDHALPTVDHAPTLHPPTIAVVGTTMDSGKTQSAAYLVKGLTHAGRRVGYAKVTGTGSGGDTWFLKDAGADPVLDFTDAGLASTYLVPPAGMRRVFLTLMAHLARSGVDAIVLEIADGVLQGETEALLESSLFGGMVDGVLFTACDAMGAVGGVAWLKHRNLPPIGLGGVLTSSPLQRREASKATGLPVYARADLAQATTARSILALVEFRRHGTALADSRANRWRNGNGNGASGAEHGLRSDDAVADGLEATR